ncbi:hydrogenase formation protein HypD [Shewanella intestini]|uniref:Hydrogenase maturation factor n=1 Tax=Shewanella intestini TaxID=2017544 RepID=A0ABS5I1Z3_9GAMM|nr:MULTISPECIES: hydrogenase formation protein HypD [Shewanella]MBR9728027.1 hydrogenase formation protein HypD [Shewanella intestini]MRG36422.1 hydrogenase formation protein HypD [Shewanella sp. XMDDZSB0408]
MMQLKDLYQGFRHPETIHTLAKSIAEHAAKVDETINIMEVCGGHTHTIMKYGLLQLLPDNINFIHGPGCPVCVMPKERIDHAAALANLPDVILVCLGDMIRVPGSKGSLAKWRSEGCDIRPIYDPLDTLTIAKENPDKTVIFFAIGFETSTPMTAVLLDQAQHQGIENIYFHINHVLVPPAIDAVMAEPKTKVNAFIGPAHVSVISGAKVYQPAVDKYHTPVVVSGFEPVDVLESILQIVKQRTENKAELEVQYNRSVTYDGNVAAQAMIDKYFDVRDSFRWRGLGPIANSALKLRDEFRHRDAEIIFKEHLPTTLIDDHKACQCGDILRGLANPVDCKVFGRGCTPETPLGSCMVSSEGACNAYYRYGGLTAKKGTSNAK